MRVASYNSRGLRSGNSDADKAKNLNVNYLLEMCDILCLQETWLPKQDLDRLNVLHKDFHGAGESTTDLSTKIVRGRIPGGVAILWNKKYDPIVSVTRLGVDWAIGLEINVDNKRMVIINIYMPYESNHSEDEFLSRLAFLRSFIEECDTTCVYIIGDFNADLSDRKALKITCL